MKTYIVTAENIEYIEGKTIRAESKEEAIEQYIEMWQQGLLMVFNSDIKKAQAKELK